MGRTNGASALASTILLLVGLATLLVPIILRKSDVEQPITSRKPAYVLVLTNATDADWLIDLRRRDATKVAVSGYGDDTPESVLERVPWLLQPGVDTLIYDLDLAGDGVIDSLATMLEAYSPATALVRRGE